MKTWRLLRSVTSCRFLAVTCLVGFMLHIFFFISYSTTFDDYFQNYDDKLRVRDFKWKEQRRESVADAQVLYTDRNLEPVADAQVLYTDRNLEPVADAQMLYTDRNLEPVADDQMLYTEKNTLEADTLELDILSTLRHVLHTLLKANQLSLDIIKQLLQGIHHKQDIDKLLTRMSRAASIPGGPASFVESLRREFNRTKPRCPDVSPNLIGYSPANMASIVPAWLESNYPRMVGGHHEPEQCHAREKLAILIPYRKRFAHLHVTLNNLLSLLVRQQTDFTIFVVEQAPPTTFNRGMLLNIGFLEALKLAHFDCFIFHDVDMSPLNDHCLYRCGHRPTLMSTGISKWGYGLPYQAYFGGVVSIKREQFRAVNGFSNLFFGWGGEDDDLRTRIINTRYKPLRYPKEIGKYETFNHLPDEGNSPNPDRLRLVSGSRDIQSKEGLLTTKYQIVSIETKVLYTWITVYINMTQVLQAAPEYLLNSIQNLVNHSQELDKLVSL